MIAIQDCLKAVGSLTMLKCFPSDPLAHAEIAKLFQRMVERPDQLNWLVDVMINHVGEWPGPAQMRGILCTRFKPLDGIEADCHLPGFTAADSEAQYLLGDEERKQIEAKIPRGGTLKRIQ